MSNEHMHKEDCEVIHMVRQGLAERQRREREAAKLLEEDNWEKTAEVWKRRIFLIVAALSRAGVGLIFIGGMAEGLMDPVFAISMTAASVAWGAGHYLKGKNA